MLLATPRNGGPSIRMTVDKACAEAGFYDLDLELEYQDEFPLDSVENALADFESRAAPIFNRMSEGDLRLSDWDWYNLTLFVALQLARGWAFREELVEIVTLRARLELQSLVTPERTRQYLKDQGLPATDRDVETMMEETLRGGWRVVPSGSMAVQAMLRYALEHLHPMLFAERRLRVFRADPPVFLTSDQPAVLWSRSDRDLEAEPLGVATADAIWLPFDRHHLLSLDPVDAPTGHKRPTKDLVEEVNRLVSAAASKWIFQHPGEPPIDVSRLPERPRWEAEVVDVRRDSEELRVLHRFLRRHPNSPDSG